MSVNDKFGAYIQRLMTTIVDKDQEQFVKDAKSRKPSAKKPVHLDQQRPGDHPAVHVVHLRS